MSHKIMEIAEITFRQTYCVQMVRVSFQFLHSPDFSSFLFKDDEQSENLYQKLNRSQKTSRPYGGKFLPAVTKLDQGNIFTSVCQEFCPQGGGCLPQCTLGYTTIPPGSRHPPSEQADPLPEKADPPWEQTPRSRPPRPSPPRPGTPPPGSRLQHTVNERPVRILPECILVSRCFIFKLKLLILFLQL